MFTTHAGFNGAVMFVNIFGVGIHRRVGSHGDGDVFTTHAGFNGRGYVCEHLWSRVSLLNCC